MTAFVRCRAVAAIDFRLPSPPLWVDLLRGGATPTPIPDIDGRLIAHTGPSNLINQSIQFALHVRDHLGLAMLELAEWLVKTKLSSRSPWTKDDRHRIECAVTAEVPKHQNGQRAPPTRARRPVEDDRAFTMRCVPSWGHLCLSDGHPDHWDHC